MGDLVACSLAIDPFQLSNVTALEAVLPAVDAIIATSPVDAAKVLTFSSASDPGTWHPPAGLQTQSRCLARWRSWMVLSLPKRDSCAVHCDTPLSIRCARTRALVRCLHTCGSLHGSGLRAEPWTLSLPREP